MQFMNQTFSNIAKIGDIINKHFHKKKHCQYIQIFKQSPFISDLNTSYQIHSNIHIKTLTLVTNIEWCPTIWDFQIVPFKVDETKHY